MAWIGVPFATEAAWVEFDWTNIDFLNQFIEAAEMRINAMQEAGGLDPVTLSRIEEGAALGTAPQLNNLRTFGNYWYKGGAAAERNVTAEDIGNRPLASRPESAYWSGNWIDPDRLALEQPFDPSSSSLGFPADIYLFNRVSGRAQARLMEIMNEILAAAGCDTISTTPTGSGDGIPWTRKTVANESPTDAAGAVAEGDIIGRHVFNEWWALLLALNTLEINRDVLEDDGSQKEVKQWNFELEEDPVVDPCSAFTGAGTLFTDTTTSGRVDPVQIDTQWAMAELGESPGTTTGFSYTEKNTVSLISPQLTHGDTFYLWAAARVATSGRIYHDFLAVGDEETLTHLVERDDDGGALALEVGATTDPMPSVAGLCAVPDEFEYIRYEQRFYAGYAAVKCVFPDP